MKNKTKEKWIQWKPLGDLGGTKYLFKSTIYDLDGLVIILEPINSKSMNRGTIKEKVNIEIKFDASIESYRCTNESFYMKAWGMVGPFFKVENSEYISWLMNVSSPYDDEHGKYIGLKHFAFIDREEIIDVIAYHDPEVKFVE